MSDHKPRKDVSENGFHIGGPNGYAVVYERRFIEPVIAALAAVTGDDAGDYTATDIDDPCVTSIDIESVFENAKSNRDGELAAAFWKRYAPVVDLESERDALSKDAARYRWLRDESLSSRYDLVAVKFWDDDSPEDLFGDDLDRRIDDYMEHGVSR